jgi:putative ABC transport system permease protein
MISEPLAKSQIPGQNPLGERLQVGPNDQPWFTMVAVAGDVRQTSLATDQAAAVDIPEEQSWFADDTLSSVIHARGKSAALAPAVRDAIWSGDGTEPVVHVMTMNRIVARGEAERRLVLILFEAFAFAAPRLAAVGMYGVLSGTVTERTSERGARAALGASRGDILALVLHDGMRLSAFRIVIAACGAAVASQALVSFLFGASRPDRIAWLGDRAARDRGGYCPLGPWLAGSLCGSSRYAACGIALTGIRQPAFSPHGECGHSAPGIFRLRWPLST